MKHTYWQNTFLPSTVVCAFLLIGLVLLVTAPVRIVSAQEMPSPTPMATVIPEGEAAVSNSLQSLEAFSSSAPSINRRVLTIEQNSDDEGMHFSDCSYYPNSTPPRGFNEVYIGHCRNGNQLNFKPIISGLRFDTTLLNDIPLISITDMYLTVGVERVYQNYLSPVAIRGHAVPNSPTFQSGNYPEHRYPNQTTATDVSWPMHSWISIPNSGPRPWTGLVKTPSLIPILQEMLGIGWNPGQPLTFIMHPTGPIPPNLPPNPSQADIDKHSRRFIALERSVDPYPLEFPAQLVVEYLEDCIPNPNDHVTLCVTDANGNPITNLTINDEGWPMLNDGDAEQIANPIHVMAVFHCPVGSGQTCTGNPSLTINSDNGQGRVYWDTEMMPIKPSGVFCTTDRAYSYEELEINCTGSTSVLVGRTKAIKGLIWVQPSAATNLQISADWGANTATADPIAVEQAEIYPVVFLHGVLGSMPPKNTNITNWPQENGEVKLDPFTGSYNPLIENLLKMGYELDHTLYPTTYDWRQSNRISACWLADTLNRMQGNATAPYVKRINNEAQADVIVHSMGGMVLRSYLQNMGRRQINNGIWSHSCNYQGDIHKAIFIATPHRGFPITYNTREKLTWYDYLSTEVSPQSDGPNHIVVGSVIPLATLMDDVVWPFFVQKQYNPTLLEPCNSAQFWRDYPLLSYFTSADEMAAGVFCSHQTRHAMAQSTATNNGRYRGIHSLLEMLPDEDAPVPYLYDSTSAYPYNRTTNPLLDGSNGLNSSTSIQTLLNHVPAEHIYTIYTDNIETITGYEVASPPPISIRPCSYLPVRGICATYYWRNGEPIDMENLITTDIRGDDLIPEYSTNLSSDWGDVALIELSNNNALASNEGGHKQVVSSATTQNAIAAILTGFTEPSVTVPRPGMTPEVFAINSPYIAPQFLISNWDTMLSFVIFSPIDVLLTDPQGRRIGYDPHTGALVNEIPDAFYSGNGTDMEFFILPPQEGDYEVTTIGTGNGAYAYAFYSVTGADTRVLAMNAGEAILGQIITKTIPYTRPVAHMFLSDTEANGPWTVDNGWGVTHAEGEIAPPAWSSAGYSPTVIGRPVLLTLNAPLDLTTARQARLWFNSKATLSVDAEAVVELSTDEGQTWQLLGEIQDSANEWQRMSYDLTPWTQPHTPSVLVRFRLQITDVAEVWLLDDIHIEGVQVPNRFHPPFYDGFEGWNRWQVTGSWERITTTVHSPAYSWHSPLSGGQLTLAGTIPLSQTVAPELSFWHQAESNTVGIVQLSANEGATWTTVYTSTGATLGWQEVSLPIALWNSDAVQLRFVHLGGASWTIDDVAVVDKPLALLHSLPVVEGFEQEETLWQGLGGWQPITSTAHSGTTSWHSTTPNSALRLLGRVDLTTAIQPALSFWHRFELPAGSLGTVDISLDEGLTWTPIYTQTTSITEWAEVTIDLTPYVGYEVALAFFLRDVATGEVLSEPTLEAVVSGTTTPTASNILLLQFGLLPLIGMGALGLLYYRPNWKKATGIGSAVLLLTTLSITSCIAVGPSPNFDPEALDIQGGDLEIVIPAEHYIMNAQVSPGGTWLAYAYRTQENNGRSSIYTAVLNIPENKLYDKLPGGASSPWLDDNHLSGSSVIWRLSDMVVMPKAIVDIESIEEGKALLAGATQLFFVQDVSRFSIQSTDPDYPYTIRFRPSKLQCNDGSDYTPCVEAMLSPDQTYQLHGMRPDSAAQVEVYSPDGQYYIYKDSYNDLTGRSGRGTSLFRTGENERLTYGYRYEWRAEFLGWAHDSSGAYILYRPKSALGDLTRSQYPIRKYLVPGAEARGLPTVISPAPTPRWLATPDVTPPASSQGEMQWVTSAQQTTPLGWVIDDIVIQETSLPLLTLWIENFPNINTLHGSNTTSSNTAAPTPTATPNYEIELPTTGPTLHWNIQASDECWGSGGWATQPTFFPTSTSQYAISEDVITTYHLTCFNQVGYSTAQTIPDPGYLTVISDFWANNQAPLFITPNTPITLQWGAAYSGGTSCQASGAWSGTKPKWGSQQLAGLGMGKHLFTLTCQGETLSVLVVVEDQPIAPTPTATASPSPTATATATATPTPTPSPTATATPSPTPTPAALVLQRVVQQGSDDADQNLTTGQTFLYHSKLNVASNGSTPYLVGIRFQNITIPAGGTILTATLQLEAEGTHSGTTILDIYGQASDNPTKFTEMYGDISSRPRTTAFTTWNIPPWTDTGGVADWVDSVNLAAVVQELVNRPNWQNGNALAFIVEGEGRRVSGSFNGATNANAPVLHITYTMP